MKVLLDINVVLDVFLDRQPWVGASQEVWRACDEGRIDGYLSSISFPTIFYIVRKAAGLKKAHESVRVCLDAFQVCVVDQRSLESALAMSGADFEDNVQIACAVAADLDFIVTRDPEGFVNSQIPAVSSDELLRKL